MTKREEQLRSTASQWRLAAESLQAAAKARGLPKALRQTLLQRWDLPVKAALKAGKGDANSRELAHYALTNAMDRERRNRGNQRLQSLAWGFQEAAALLDSLLDGEPKPRGK